MSTGLASNASEPIALITPSISPKLIRQPASDEFLARWLEQNNLKHLYDKMHQSHVSIIDLSECNEKVIRETARTAFDLSGDELLKLTKALIRYNELQCLTKKTKDISSYIDKLEQVKNEMRIKHNDDIVFVEQKFKNMMKALKKRENILVAELKKNQQNKMHLLNEQVLNLKDCKQQMEDQYNLLLSSEANEKREALYGNNKIAFDKQRFAKMKKVNVDIANYDDMISQIKSTGIISDEFDDKHVENEDIDNDEMNCLCGTQLVLTAIDAAYAHNDIIFCNFCSSKCLLQNNNEIYHCPQGDVKLHPGGFDLCYFCGTKCLESRKADRRREKEERKNSSNKRKRSHTNCILPSHKRSASAMPSTQWHKNANYLDSNSFLYRKQLKQLQDMGYDTKNAAKLLVKYKGNMIKTVAEFIT